ncbi:hypothetical protein TUM12370_09440 [Salmonella enterica subsp. enterica serovar Choleraesuis]|nr:hypothetical protein TUM12370_09440 [Salmonella enterica subsp. enterica serovar Choleraesuis]
MAKNDFKPFASGENANVLTQAEYEALEAVGSGFQSGIARSEQLNKVWRQSSAVAATLGSFIADKSGDDVLDDGDLKKLQTSLIKALLNNSTSQLDGRYLNVAKNLSDLSDATKARQSLGLKGAAIQDVGTTTGTVAAGNDSRIVNALQRGNNLSDVTNAATSRSNLGLGSAATSTVTTSNRDTTAGRLVKTADYGIGRTIGTVTTGIDFRTYAFIQGEHLFVNTSTCTNIPPGINTSAYYFIFVHGLRDNDGSPGLTMINYTDPQEYWVLYGAGAAGSRTFRLCRTYNTGYKPSAGDVGALPSGGNAVSASKLATARTIGGVLFDGSSNINLPGVNIQGNQNTTGNATSATRLQTARTIGGVSFNGTSNINLPGVNTQGNQNTTGNAASATRLQTARTINGVSFNGTANITITPAQIGSYTKAESDSRYARSPVNVGAGGVGTYTFIATVTAQTLKFGSAVSGPLKAMIAANQKYYAGSALAGTWIWLGYDGPIQGTYCYGVAYRSA